MTEEESKKADDPAAGAYQKAGVDIDAQEAALSGIGDLVRSTNTPGVLSELGSFGGLFALGDRAEGEPVLVASADGVGTKLMVARMVGDYSTVGRDLVNHCVNDILVQGARPLFFLDYVGTGELDPRAVVDLVRGITDGCRENGCALLGGETAEMPGFYAPGDYELVGFVVGLVQRSELLDGSRVRAGDRILGLRSSGLHTNGYSLARRVFFDEMGLGVRDPVPGLDPDTTLGEHLLAVHRSYLPGLSPVIGDPALHGLAHITGGGLTDNVPRLLSPSLRAVIDTGAWEVPGLFGAIEEHGKVDRTEMFRVFNMGIGMAVIVEHEAAERISEDLRGRGEDPVTIGEVEEITRPGEDVEQVVYVDRGEGR